MLNANDLKQLADKGISEQQIEEQLACFVKGFPYLEIAASASVEKGIRLYRRKTRQPIWVHGILTWLKINGS